MFKSFDECCAEVGLTRKTKSPELVYRWVAYVSGDIIECGSMNEAMKMSSLYEKLVTPESKEIHDSYFSDRTKLEAEAAKLWYDDLRVYFFNVRDDAFSILYSQAYDDGHHSGYDLVGEYLTKYINLLEKIHELPKK